MQTLGMTTAASVVFDTQTQQLNCSGDWDLAHFSDLKTQLEKMHWPDSGEITFNGADIKQMDSAGAWLINHWNRQLTGKKLTVNLVNFNDEHKKLLEIIEKEIEQKSEQLPERKEPTWLERVGRDTIQQLCGFRDYLSFIGLLSIEALRLAPTPAHWRVSALVNVIYRNGYLALPIIALLSFMIGVVLTYQMGLQLRNYGANIYIVDLLGLAVLREFGPLLTAIMVAGRTGSAYTAQLGIMKINQEIDALDTMGVTPAELLLLPRVIGLIIALPLLAMWANVFGVLGGMVMANNMLNITWYDFLQRFPHVIALKTLLIGLGKTPVFAFIIATTGCYQGMKVEGSADSVGRNTTRSVVLAIFFIIVADAAFSVILSKLKL